MLVKVKYNSGVQSVVGPPVFTVMLSKYNVPCAIPISFPPLPVYRRSSEDEGEPPVMRYGGCRNVPSGAWGNVKLLALFGSLIWPSARKVLPASTARQPP